MSTFFYFIRLQTSLVPTSNKETVLSLLYGLDPLELILDTPRDVSLVYSVRTKHFGVLGTLRDQEQSREQGKSGKIHKGSV